MGETAWKALAVAGVRRLLPAGWSLDAQAAPGGTLGGFIDAELVLRGPSGQSAGFLVSAWRSGTLGASEVVGILDSMATSTERRVLLLSDYLGPVLRRRVAEAGHSYADGSGWVRLVSADPLVLLTGEGAARAPGPPRLSAVTRFNRRASSRIIRSLLEQEIPVGVRELATIADVSPGSVSKHLATFAAEGLVERTSGGVSSVRRRDLLQRWTEDYDFASANGSVIWCLAPRGLDGARERIAQRSDAVLTGSLGSRQLLPADTVPVAPLTLGAVYTSEPQQLKQDLGLVEVSQGRANLVLARPQDPVILDGGDVAPTGLVLADLLTLPGRADAEAEQLMDALAKTDPLWEQ